MRDRLAKIISDFKIVQTRGIPLSHEEVYLQFADYLLANGIIVPPCKVGDTVYMPWVWSGTKGVAILEVIRIVDDFTERSTYVSTNFFTDDEDYWVAYNGGRFEFSDFGKTVFLTREEAEEALERSKK